tara:strand:- start:416 stop:1015 length:600 start_codon:yes stop_codon:yes gene_type:complete
MGLFRPNPKKEEGGSGKYSGVCEVGIINFTDKSEEYDWADIYIDIEFALKDSQYSRNMQIAGSLEKDASGNITGGSVLDKMYRIFDTINCSAGVNIKGEWETNEGEPIKDIAGYLNNNYCSNFMPDTPPVLNYVAYIYRKQNKNTGTLFTTMLPKLYPNTAKGKEEMESYAKWMKNNNYLNEVKEGPASENPVVSVDAL